MKTFYLSIKTVFANTIAVAGAQLLICLVLICLNSHSYAVDRKIHRHYIKNGSGVKKSGQKRYDAAFKKPGIFTLPALSYASPQSFGLGVPIAPLTPASSGVAAAGYSGLAVPFRSGLQHPRGIATDGASNVFVSDFGASLITEYPAGGGTSLTIGSGFQNPDGVAVDGQENVYVSDYGSGKIKKVPAGGGTITNIGTGYNAPYGVAADAAGNAYVADYLNGVVRKISANGGATTVIGSGFTNPAGVAVDAAGNVYVADFGSSLVKEILASDGSTISLGANFLAPYGIAVDNSGNVFVADFGHSALKEIIKGGGQTITVATGFQTLTGVALDNAGIIYTADYDNTVVESFTPVGGYYVSPALPPGLSIDNSTGIISGTPTTLSPARFYTVTAYNSSGSTSFKINIGVIALSVSYASPQSYTKGTAISPLSPTIVGSVSSAGYSASPVITNTTVSNPTDVAIDALNNVYIVQQTSNLVTKFPAGGGASVTLGSGFSSPFSLAVDGSGNIYVADFNNNAIKEIPSGNGTPITLGSGFNGPFGVAVDSSGNVYVADTGNDAIKEIPVGGGPVITLGAGFNFPTAIAVDGYGNVFVADDGHGAIKKIPAGNGTPITLASGLSSPYGVTVDATGNVFYTERGGNVLKEIPGGSGSSLTLATGLNLPYNLAVDVSGNIYLADFGNKAIKKIAPTGGYYLSKALPPGLSFSNTTGTITGTPTVLSPASNYTVTAYNASGSGSAVVNIKVSVGANASLAGLALSNGTLSPAFSASTTNYTDSVGNGLASMTITPTAADPMASITVNGVAVTSGNASQNLPLVVGPNTITTVVTAQDGTTKLIYTLVVNETQSSIATLSSMGPSIGPLSPVFNSATTGYTLNVSNATATMTVKPVSTDANATIKVNSTAVPSGTPSGPITLAPGAATAINVVVTAQDGTTTKTYIVTVTRAPSGVATLSAMGPSIGPLSPTFIPGTTSYALSVTNATATMTVKPVTTDAHATVKVNGTAVPAGTTSGPIALAPGSTTAINVVVTAQDGATTKTYTITVTRAPSIVATLSGIGASITPLTPVFNPATTGYTLSVSNATATMTLKPVTTDPNATIKVNGTTLISGTTSAPIALAEGTTTAINVVVTAQNGTNTKTYTITVTRAPSGVATLASIGSSITPLTPIFNANTTSYTLNVPNGTTTMTVKPVTTDAHASIKVNGTATPSGTTFGPIALIPGSNTITTAVTAQDGSTTKTYTITVTRAPGGADSFDPGISVTKPTETPAITDDGILVHQGVSPNGDGVNDFLQIDNISQYPDNKLTIMNRNGQIIYETKGYDNSSKVFDGHSNKNEQKQLPGTYFYQLDYTVNGIARHKTGFIVLKY